MPHGFDAHKPVMAGQFNFFLFSLCTIDAGWHPNKYILYSILFYGGITIVSIKIRHP